MNAAVDILKNRPDIRCVYIHTTDYPMHMWAPEDINSINHLSAIDKYLEQLTKVAPDAMILITADHDVNHKSRCVDIEKKLATKGVLIKIALSVEKDKYPIHHRGFGGTSYVYLNKGQNEVSIKKYLMEMNGVKSVLTKKEAALKFHLMESRIGDLVVLADSNTVFGTLEASNEEILPENYRSHGSEFEVKVPLIMYNVPPILLSKSYHFNKDITSWLFKLN
jgi:phosphonoacetate hydrolase